MSLQDAVIVLLLLVSLKVIARILVSMLSLSLDPMSEGEWAGLRYGRSRRDCPYWLPGWRREAWLLGYSDGRHAQMLSVLCAAGVDPECVIRVSAS